LTTMGVPVFPVLSRKAGMKKSLGRKITAL